MIRNRLFRWFTFLVITLGVTSAVVAIRLIKDEVVREAQARVLSDLRGARSMQGDRLDEIRAALELAAGEQMVLDGLLADRWPDIGLQTRLEAVRLTLGLDFLTLVAPGGQVLVRAAPPYSSGDDRSDCGVIRTALQGNAVTSIELMEPGQLDLENKGLSRRAFLRLKETPHARPTRRTEEERGMVFLTAVPVVSGSRIFGAVYGGLLLNKNHGMVDRIRDVVFKDEQYLGKPAGTVTIFLHDSRVATTVTLADGSRALGTRVSAEVSDRVLGQGLRWEGRAFVVRDWYLTAYEPLRNFQGDIIGMLYVGLLEQPYEDLITRTIFNYMAVSVLAVALALVLAFLVAGKISQPLHVLATAADGMNEGRPFEPVVCKGASKETQGLIRAFNAMVAALTEREENLHKANRKLEEANRELAKINHDYMEAVGFVSHELKSPMAAILNYVYLMQGQKSGSLTEKQSRYMRKIDGNVRRLLEMVRHYLSLSRIENGVLEPVLGRVEVLEEVLEPLLESFREDASKRGMQLVNAIGKEIAVEADLNMAREVFENLLSNAVKYGREDGLIRLDAVEQGDFTRFSVFNEGEGIPPGKVRSLFQKFHRIEGMKANRGQKGTGLGLFITKHIVEAHSGEIGVELYGGKGVSFIFTLPAATRDRVYGQRAAGC